MLNMSAKKSYDRPRCPTTPATVLAAALIAAAASVGWTAVTGPDSIEIAEGSKVWVEGGSTVRSWKCEAVGMEGMIGTNAGVSVLSLVDLSKLIRDVTIDISVEKMECGNNTMNDHMRKALNSKQNPQIRFVVSGYDLAMTTDSTAKLTMNGKLTIAGKTNDVVVAGTAVRGADGIIRVQGKHDFPMTQFGVKPPSLMLGTMKVKDPVSVSFDIALK